MRLPSLLIPIAIAALSQGFLSRAAKSGQMPGDMPLSDVYIKNFNANGSGCNAGTFESNLSPDKKAFTITYSNFIAELGQGINPGQARKNCAITVNLSVPAGYQYTVGTFNYRGFMDLDAGVKADFNTLYFFQNGIQGNYKRTQEGAFSDNYVFTDAVGFTTGYVPNNWSPCDVERALTINATIALTRLPGAAANVSGLVANDSIDGELTQEFGIAYRRCGETTPPVVTPPDTTNPGTGGNDPSPTNGLENGKIYNLVSRYSGQCLDVRDHALSSGAPLQQWSCTGEAQQKFKALYLRDGRWSLVGVQSGKNVSVENGWGDNGNSIFQSDWIDGDHQKMFVDRSTDGSYKLKFSHSQRCLDIDGPSFAAGTRVHQWDCQAGLASQDWFFFADRPAVQANAEYQLVNRSSGKCFDVFDHGIVNGVRLQQWTCTNEPHQKFRLQDFGAGNYSLVGVSSGKTVTVRDWAQWNGAELIIDDDRWGANQRLILVPSIDGSFQVRFNHSNKCLDLDSGSSADGAKVQQWDCQVGNSHQDWVLRR